MFTWASLSSFMGIPIVDVMIAVSGYRRMRWRGAAHVWGLKSSLALKVKIDMGRAALGFYAKT
jgi:hypothetical protein